MARRVAMKRASGLVLGVDRAGIATALHQHGADWVIDDFSKISARNVLDYFRSRALAS